MRFLKIIFASLNFLSSSSDCYDVDMKKYAFDYSEGKKETWKVILLSFHEFLSDFLYIYRVNRSI